VTAFPPGAGRPGPAGVVLVAALLIACAAAGFWFHRMRTDGARTTVSHPAPVTGPVGTSGQPAGRPRIPEQVPPIRLPDPAGRPHSLSEWGGGPLIVNFWATWCEPCRREIPLLKSLRREHASEGLEVVGIALDAPDAVRTYVTEQAVGYPVLIGEHGGLEAAAAFGMDTVLPFSVFADRRGQIVGLKIGELHPDEAELLLGVVRQVDEDKLTLKAARDEIASAMPSLAAARARMQNAASQ
jgi:thiol-disulfide isomerase/thioredoxin